MESHDCETHGHPFRTAVQRGDERLAPRCLQCLHPEHFTACPGCDCDRSPGVSLATRAGFTVVFAATVAWRAGVRAGALYLGVWALFWIALFGISYYRFARRMRIGVLVHEDELPDP